MAIMRVYAKDRQSQQALLAMHGVTAEQVEVAEQHAPGQRFAVMFTLPEHDPEHARETLGP